MEGPWAAERAVSAEHARALVEAQFRHLAPARLEPTAPRRESAVWLGNAAAGAERCRRAPLTPT
jgi:hypothetical protein